MSNIKIYAVGDSDWCAADNQQGAEQAFAEHYGYTNLSGYLSDYDETDISIQELSEPEMKRLQFINDDDAQTSVSFALKLNEMLKNGNQFPVHFAATDW